MREVFGRLREGDFIMKNISIPNRAREVLLSAVESGVHDGKDQADFSSSLGRAILGLAVEGAITPQQFLSVYGEAPNLGVEIMRVAEECIRAGEKEVGSQLNDYLILVLPRAKNNGHED